MTGYEIMLSESQERMLFIVEKGREAEVNKIFSKWDLHAEIIGAVEDAETLTVRVNGKIVAKIPPQSLVLGGDAPVYIRETKEPAYLAETRGFDIGGVSIPKDLNEPFRKLLAHPSIANKRWVYEQYDSMVRTNSVLTNGGDAAIIRVKGTQKGLAVKTDCNGRYVYLNPRKGAEIAVAEAARNVVCVGAKPVGITNCLNFGNPYDPEVYWQFKSAVEGIGNACRYFDTPVTGGNVSFYNESPTAAVYPTPVIGMLGILDDVESGIGSRVGRDGELLLLLGALSDDLGGSQYLEQRVGRAVGDAPEFDLKKEKDVQSAALASIRARLVTAAHDVSDGGLAVALFEMVAGSPGLGLDVDVSARLGQRIDGVLFGEAQSRILLAVEDKNAAAIETICRDSGVECHRLGKVTKTGELRIGAGIGMRTDDAADIYDNSIGKLMANEL